MPYGWGWGDRQHVETFGSSSRRLRLLRLRGRGLSCRATRARHADGAAQRSDGRRDPKSQRIDFDHIQPADILFVGKALQVEGHRGERDHTRQPGADR